MAAVKKLKIHLSHLQVPIFESGTRCDIPDTSSFMITVDAVHKGTNSRGITQVVLLPASPSYHHWIPPKKAKPSPGTIQPAAPMFQIEPLDRLSFLQPSTLHCVGPCWTVGPPRPTGRASEHTWAGQGLECLRVSWRRFCCARLPT